MSNNERDLADIEVLLARYSNRLDRSDHSGWVELFTSNGRFEAYGRSFDGHDGLLGMAESAPPGLHLTSAPLIEIDGDEARVEQSFLFVDQVSHDTRIGWYDDQLVRTAEGWRFRVRRSTFLRPDGPSDRP
jgi:hypothetical protein